MNKQIQFLLIHTDIFQEITEYVLKDTANCFRNLEFLSQICMKF